MFIIKYNIQNILYTNQKSKLVISDQCCNNVRNTASFYIPSKLANLSPDIADRIYAAYCSDLGDKNEFDDEIARWKICWSLEDEKPGGLLNILNVCIICNQ